MSCTLIDKRITQMEKTHASQFDDKGQVSRRFYFRVVGHVLEAKRIEGNPVEAVVFISARF